MPGGSARPSSRSSAASCVPSGRPVRAARVRCGSRPRRTGCGPRSARTRSSAGSTSRPASTPWPRSSQRDLMVPLTDATIAFMVGGILDVRDWPTLVINRELASWYQPAEGRRCRRREPAGAAADADGRRDLVPAGGARPSLAYRPPIERDGMRGPRRAGPSPARSRLPELQPADHPAALAAPRLEQLEHPGVARRAARRPGRSRPGSAGGSRRC